MKPQKSESGVQKRKKCKYTVSYKENSIMGEERKKRVHRQQYLLSTDCMSEIENHSAL